MEKQILTILAMMLFSAAADLFGATSITYEQTQWTVTQMTDQSYVTGGIFPYSYDTKAIAIETRDNKTFYYSRRMKNQKVPDADRLFEMLQQACANNAANLTA